MAGLSRWSYLVILCACTPDLATNDSRPAPARAPGAGSGLGRAAANTARASRVLVDQSGTAFDVETLAAPTDEPMVVTPDQTFGRSQIERDRAAGRAAAGA